MHENELFFVGPSYVLVPGRRQVEEGVFEGGRERLECVVCASLGPSHESAGPCAASVRARGNPLNLISANDILVWPWSGCGGFRCWTLPRRAVVDDNRSPSSTVGAAHHDPANGDARSGSHIFSCRIGLRPLENLGPERMGGTATKAVKETLMGGHERHYI